MPLHLNNVSSDLGAMAGMDPVMSAPSIFNLPSLGMDSILQPGLTNNESIEGDAFIKRLIAQTTENQTGIANQTSTQGGIERMLGASGATPTGQGFNPGMFTSGGLVASGM